MNRGKSLSNLTITSDDEGTLVLLNDKSEIFLEDFTGTLTKSDFIF